jgi:carboxylate-amine ligase
VNETFITFEKQKTWHENILTQIFDQTVKLGQKARIDNMEYLKIFGMNSTASAGEIWQRIVDQVSSSGDGTGHRWKPLISTILSQGTLADRILKALHGDFSEKSIKKVYHLLSDCLEKNQMFSPN